MDSILAFDERLLLFFNSLHTPWLDTLMFALTNGLYWLPFFIGVVVFILRAYKWNGLLVLALVGVAIALSDQLSASIIKPWVGRLRPSHTPHLQHLLHIVNNYRGGSFSFVSSHATNSFAVATLLWLLLGRYHKWIGLFFVWAGFFSFTRLYLGVHFPLDVLCGGLLGAGIAWGVYKLATLFLAPYLPHAVRPTSTPPA